jgi:transcriptional regulator with XRE-family HTH domain
MLELRLALGSKGKGTTMRGFAKELGASPQAYRYWEKPGSYPGHSKLAGALERVAGVRERKLDPSRLAVWLETGEGVAPWLVPSGSGNFTNAPTPTATDLRNVGSQDLDHRTPWRMLVTLADLARAGKQDEIKDLLGILGPVAHGVLEREAGQGGAR